MKNLLSVPYNKGIYKATLYQKRIATQDIRSNYDGKRNIVFKYDGISNYVTEIRTGKKIPIIFIDTNTCTQKTHVKLPLKRISNYPICVFFQTYHGLTPQKQFMDYFYNEFPENFENANSYNLLYHDNEYVITINQILYEYLNENRDKDKLMEELRELENRGLDNIDDEINYYRYYSQELGKRQSTFDWDFASANETKKMNKQKFYYKDYEENIGSIIESLGFPKEKEKELKVKIKSRSLDLFQCPY